MLDEKISGRFIRIYPQTWSNNICIRVEIYGCEGQGNVVSLNQTSNNLSYWRFLAVFSWSLRIECQGRIQGRVVGAAISYEDFDELTNNERVMAN